MKTVKVTAWKLFFFCFCFCFFALDQEYTTCGSQVTLGPLWLFGLIKIIEYNSIVTSGETSRRTH